MLYLELELHGLESGRSLDVPCTSLLSDVHLGGGYRGRLSQKEAHVQGLVLFPLFSSNPAIQNPEQNIHQILEIVADMKSICLTLRNSSYWSADVLV